MTRACAVEIHQGFGLTGTCAGVPIAIGNRGLMALRQIPLTPDIEQRVASWESQGYTVATIARDGATQGAMAFGDRIRADAPGRSLPCRLAGQKTILLSGDTEQATRRVAEVLGAGGFQAEVLPDGNGNTWRSSRPRAVSWPWSETESTMPRAGRGQPRYRARLRRRHRHAGRASGADGQ